MMAKNLDERIKITEEENCLILCGEDDENKGYIQFYDDKDESGYSFTFIEEVESYYPGEGNFSILFKKLKSVARKQKSKYLLLTVDSCNSHAILIYQHLGFYFLREEDLHSGNVDEILMRKDLLFDGE